MYTQACANTHTNTRLALSFHCDTHTHTHTHTPVVWVQPHLAASLLSASRTLWPGDAFVGGSHDHYEARRQSVLSPEPTKRNEMSPIFLQTKNSSKKQCWSFFFFITLQQHTHICSYSIGGNCCRQGCLCFGLCGPHQCRADTGADTWQKASFIPHAWVTNPYRPSAALPCQSGYCCAIGHAREQAVLWTSDRN